MCCSLESIGLEILQSKAECEDSGPTKAATDGSCIEGGHYQSANASIKIALPVSALCTCFICARPFISESDLHPAVVVAELARPRDWIPIWQFERRAAAPAHAPDSFTA